MDERLYRAPSAEIHEAPTLPSRRLLHCTVAWVSGFLSLPTAYAVLRLVLRDDMGGPLLRLVQPVDLAMFAVAGAVAAICVAPFPRLAWWVAALAGGLPAAFLILLAAASVLHEHAA